MVKRKASKQSGPTAKRNKKYVVLKWKSSKNKRTSVRKHSTKPRTKTNYVPVAGGTLHSGTGACKVVIPIGKGARKGRRVGPWTFRESYTGVAGSVAGKAGFKEVFSLLHSLQLRNQSGVGGLIGSDVNKTVRSLFQMNPYQNITGSKDVSGINGYNQITNTTTDQQLKNDQIKLNGITVELDLCNLTSAGVVVEILIFLTKRDTEANPRDLSTGLWSKANINGVGNVNMGSTAVTFPGSAVVSAGIADVGYPTVDLVGTNITECPSFGKWFKTLYRKKMTLAAAAQEKCEFTFKIHKILKAIESDVMVGQMSQNLYLKGHTISCYVKTVGQICIDNTVSTAPLPTYAPTEVGYIAQVKYQLGSVKNNAERIRSDIACNTVPAFGTNANLRAVNYVDQVGSIVQV